MMEQMLPGAQSKFPLGQLAMTCGVVDKSVENLAFTTFCVASLKRHGQGDWGELCDEDKKANDEALKSGEERLFSAYEKEGFPKIWIITEWDRSVTTTLLPEEY